MAGVIHIAEVAAILTLAYVVGWGLGYLAHLLLARQPAANAATVPAEAVAAVVAAAEADALVRAPVIDPVPSSPPPTVGREPEPPASVPAPAAIVMEPMPVVEPAEAPPAAASEPASPVKPEPSLAELTPLAIPVIAAPPPMRVDPLPRRRPPPDPAPPPPPEPEVILTATPAMKPGEAWSGTVRGRAAAPLERAEVAEPAVVDNAPPVAFSAPPVDVPLAMDLGPVGPDSTHGEPVLPAPPEPPPGPVAAVPEPQPEAVAVVPDPQPETVAAVPEHQAPPLDEDAAMRAIEGGWSRTRARAMSNSPELSDVGAAVAAAQSAVEQVLARAGIDAEAPRNEGRPTGLPRPREGKRDDLKRINGLGALDESTLNNLGVYHFDQIAGWSEPEVRWMENHVFARGRIGREDWQQQARALAAPVAI